MDSKSKIVSSPPLACPQNIEWWRIRHQYKKRELQELNNIVDLVFLGDSITHAWEDLGADTWQQYYGHLNAINLGFAGDRTEHLLWRIQNGAVDCISPKLLVLLIGTNNAGHLQQASTDTALSIKAILDELTTRLPKTKILLMAIFPRSKHPDQRLRKLVTGTNQLIKNMADNQRILWLDINQQFLDQQGILHESVMPDFLHPNAAQYQLWANALEPFVKQLVSR